MTSRLTQGRARPTVTTPSKLIVLTPAYYTNLSQLQELVTSCELLGVHLHAYGLGENWPWHVEGKVRRPLREVRDLDCSHILFTDADSFLLTKEDDIITRYIGTGFPVVASCERTCWPDGSLAEEYPPPTDPSAYRFLNSGGYIGTKQAMLQLWSHMLAIHDDATDEGLAFASDDQWLLAQAYLAPQSRHLITRDTHCHIFQTMAGGDAPFPVSPCVKHFNGRTKGIHEAFLARFGRGA